MSSGKGEYIASCNYRKSKIMTVANKIQEALKSIMSDGEANACNVFKGYDIDTHQNGWHYTPFGRNSIFIGKNKNEALEEIEMIADEQQEIREAYLRSIR